MTISTLTDLFARFESFGEATALIAFTPEGRNELTFRQLCQRSRAFAGGMMLHGLSRGVPVALFAPNSIDWVLCRLALILLDAPCVPVDDDVGADRLRQILAVSRVQRLFTVPQYLATARQAVSGIDRPVEIILLDRAGGDQVEAVILEDLTAEPIAEPAPATPDGITSQFFTSGTTGPPKAVPLTHGNIATNLNVLLELGLTGVTDRVLLPLPLHHSYPFIVGLLLPLTTGSTIVLPAGLSGPMLVSAMKEAEVTALVGVPRLYEALIAAIDAQIRNRGIVAARAFRLLMAVSMGARKGFGLRLGRWLFAALHRQFAPKLKLLVSGGAHLDAGVGWRLEALGYRVLTGYGLVETTSVATFNAPHASRIGSAGKPSTAVEMRIAPVEDMEHGEIQFRGAIVFSGYPGNPDANAAAFTEDGWFRTGDLGWRDGDGYLHIAGRLKEMIVTPGGKNVAPEHVEEIYTGSPLIKEVAVLEHRSRLVAIVVPDFETVRESSTAGPETQIRIALGELGQRLPRYMRIADFVLTREPLPRNPIGKFRRYLLPAIYDRAERGERAAPPALSREDEARLATKRARRLLTWLESRFPDAPIEPDTQLQMELGVDSLEWISLSLELRERLGVILAEETIAGIVTVRDLIDAVERAGKTEGESPLPRETPPDQLKEDRRRWLKEPDRVARAAGLLLHGVASILARTLFRLRVDGRERVPFAGPLIIVANHTSDLDPIMLAAALPMPTLRKSWWSGEARRVFGNAAGRLLARTARIFPVDERTPSASLDLAVEVLKRDRILIWFPEEWRSPTGELQEFRPGIGALVARTGASILPCHIGGTFEAMPRSARIPKPHPVRVRFGDPVPAQDLLPDPAPADAPALHAAIAAKVRKKIAALADGRS